MQAPWTRTPLRLAVPVTRGLSCLNSTTINTFNSPLLSLSYSLPPSHPAAPNPPLSSPHPTRTQSRPASSSSGSWKIRQSSDSFARAARVQGYRSRAAFKLFEMNIKYGLFRRHTGQVVVDLGYAPGSWSQVAVDRTAPNGTVLGIDIIPAQPPKGVSTIQGNFLSPRVREMVKQVLVEGDRRRREERRAEMVERRRRREGEEGGDEVPDRPSYIDMERMAAHESEAEIDSSPVSPSSSSSLSPDESTEAKEESTQPTEDRTQPTEENPQPKEESAQPAEESTQPKEGKRSNLRLVDVVLSDMMMNTSGIFFKDHAGSMDLCYAALTFASETLKPGGHFVCKFYQGAEDKALEDKLKQMFETVHREKPDASRKESRESFFVALRRIGNVTLEDIERE